MSKVTNVLTKINTGDEQKLRKSIKEYVRASCTNQIPVSVADRFNKGQYRCYVQCGKCENCRNTKRNELYTRMYLDAMMLQHAYFVTLTYKGYENVEDIPYSLLHNVWHKDMHNKENTLCYSPCLLNYVDMQKFLKRLRINLTRKLGFTPFLEYYVAGEMGHRFGRPHWHIVILADTPLKKLDFMRAWSINHELIGRVDFEDLFANGTMAGKNEKNSKKCFKYVSKYASKSERDFNKDRLAMAYEFLIPDKADKQCDNMGYKRIGYKKEEFAPINDIPLQLKKYYEINEIFDDWTSFNDFVSVFNQRTQRSTGHALGVLYFEANAERFVSGNTSLHLPDVATSFEVALQRKATLPPLLFPTYYRYRVAREKERFRILHRSVSDNSSISKMLYESDMVALLTLAQAVYSHTWDLLDGRSRPLAAADFGNFKDLDGALQRGISLFIGHVDGERTTKTPYWLHRYSTLFDVVARETYRPIVTREGDFCYMRFEVTRYSRKSKKHYLVRYESFETVYNWMLLSMQENAKEWTITKGQILANTSLQDFLQKRAIHFREYMKMEVSELAHKFYELEKEENAKDWQNVKMKNKFKQINKGTIYEG